MKRLKGLYYVLKDRGFTYAFKRVFFPPRIKNYDTVKKLFQGKSGIEIGGPSAIFRVNNLVPIYNIIKSLDGCNFSTTTIWEGNINSGKTFSYYKNKKGTQYICEATDLSMIPNNTYDFVISSNCLEHVANPLKALKEWLRVIKPDGAIILVLPNRDYCFDHNRPVTLFLHLLEDFQKNIGEDDMTHLDEILELHDLSMDVPAGDHEQFKARSLKNFENRALHHHVFDIALLKQLFDYLHLNILITHEGEMNVIVGTKKVA